MNSLGIYLTSSAQAAVTKNTISGNNLGIYLEGSARVTIGKCTISENEIGGIDLTDFA